MAGGLVSTRPSSNAMAVAEALPPSLLWLPTISPHMVAWWLTRVGSVATLDGQARCEETGRSMLEGQLTLGGGDFFASSSFWRSLPTVVVRGAVVMTAALRILQSNVLANYIVNHGRNGECLFPANE